MMLVQLLVVVGVISARSVEDEVISMEKREDVNKIGPYCQEVLACGIVVTCDCADIYPTFHGCQEGKTLNGITRHSIGFDNFQNHNSVEHALSKRQEPEEPEELDPDSEGCNLRSIKRRDYVGTEVMDHIPGHMAALIKIMDNASAGKCHLIFEQCLGPLEEEDRYVFYVMVEETAINRVLVAIDLKYKKDWMVENEGYHVRCYEVSGSKIWCEL